MLWTAPQRIGMIGIGVAMAASVSTAHAQTSTAKAAIDSSVSRIIIAANSADANGAFAAASTDLVMVSGTTVYATRDSALAFVTRVYKGLRRQDIRLEQASVRVLSPMLAIYTANGTFASTDTANVVTARRPFAWTMVWRLEGGSWKMVSIHQSLGAAQ